jgi:Protein kinase domain
MATTPEEEAADNEQLELQNADHALGKRTPLETLNELMEEWVRCAGATDRDKIRLELIRKTPHLETKFKDEVETIKNFHLGIRDAEGATDKTAASQHEGAERNELAESEEDDDKLDAIINNVKADDKERLRALLKRQERNEQERERNERERKVFRCYEILFQYIAKTESATRAVTNTLAHLAALSQAEQSLVITNSRRSDAESTNQLIKDYAVEAEEDLRLRAKPDLDGLKRGILKSFCENEKLLESTEPDATYSTDWLQFDESDDIYHAMVQFNIKFQSVFRSATLADKKKTDQEDFRLQIRDLEEVLCNRGIPTKFVIPAPDSSEVDFVQPYLLGLLRALGTSVSAAQRLGAQNRAANASLNSSTLPPEHQIKSGRRFVSNPVRHKRTPDHTIAVDARHIYMLRDDTTEITVEEKTMFTSDHMPIQLIESAKDQVCSHLAKQVTVGSTFMGYGIDTCATGAIVTPACVVLLQLRLRGTATPDIHLELLQTSYLPLLSQANYNQWMKAVRSHSKQRQEASDNLRCLLYPENSRDDKKVPTGLLALARLMTSSRDELFGPALFTGALKAKTSRIEDVALGAMIGFGAFATVYKCTTPEGYVAKISRYGAKREMDNEANVLRDLKKLKVAEGIPSVLDCTTIIVDLLGLTLRLNALLIKPFGISLPVAMAEDPSRFPIIFDHLSKALQSVHACEYFHNDVSPKNLLWDRIADRAFLSDFGLASKGGERVFGVRGNLLYIHRDIYEQHPAKAWIPEAKYDNVALYFSLAAVVSVTCPWKPPHRPLQPKEIEAWDVVRQQRAREALANNRNNFPIFDQWCNENEVEMGLSKHDLYSTNMATSQKTGGSGKDAEGAEGAEAQGKESEGAKGQRKKEEGAEARGEETEGAEEVGLL